MTASETEQVVDRARPPHGRARLDRAWWRRLARQLVQFGLVGGSGFIVDLGIYNLLLATVLGADDLHWGPMLANALSTLVAIGWNWIGNRLWTFRAERRRDSLREGAEFFAVSFVGLLVGLIPLGLTHYLLGLATPLWDNLAKIIGIGLGSVFRFAMYRWWVFAPARRR